MSVQWRFVSVPLRGLDIRKPTNQEIQITQKVSVPLRGLDIRKLDKRIDDKVKQSSFSPLAGIRYSETE